MITLPPLMIKLAGICSRGNAGRVDDLLLLDRVRRGWSTMPQWVVKEKLPSGALDGLARAPQNVQGRTGHLRKGVPT
jgi:hypothetical protein